MNKIDLKLEKIVDFSIKYKHNKNAIEKAFKELKNYTPGWMPEYVIEENKPEGMYDDGDEYAPFFSEAYLYNLLGKDKARELLYLIKQLEEKIGNQ